MNIDQFERKRIIKLTSCSSIVFFCHSFNERCEKICLVNTAV